MLSPAVTRPEIPKLVEILRENVAITISKPVIVHDFLKSRDSVIEFVPVAGALKLAEFLPHFREPVAVASVPVGIGFRAFEVNSHAAEQISGTAIVGVAP